MSNGEKNENRIIFFKLKSNLVKKKKKRRRLLVGLVSVSSFRCLVMIDCCILGLKYDCDALMIDQGDDVDLNEGTIKRVRGHGERYFKNHFFNQNMFGINNTLIAITPKVKLSTYLKKKSKKSFFFSTNERTNRTQLTEKWKNNFPFVFDFHRQHFSIFRCPLSSSFFFYLLTRFIITVDV